jgi:hypothetical protein
VLGTITIKQYELIMLSKTQAKIKSILKELEERREIKENKHWYVVTITYSTETFYRRLNSVSDFYKRISNSKATLVGQPSNREWWKELDPSGFYDFAPNKDIVVLSFVLETKKKINELEFKSRVKKIAPYNEIFIGTKTQKDFEFELAFIKEFFLKYEAKTELFGDVKRNTKYNELPV